MKFYHKFKIRVVYKSGYQHDFWVWRISVKTDGSIEWTCADPVNNRPMVFAKSLDDIEAVWKVGHKAVFRFKNPDLETN